MNFFNTTITEKAKEKVMQCLNSGHLSEGELVQEFEYELERIFGYVFGVAVNSGTSALHLALILSGVGDGDEVILPAQTFIATGLAVLYCGAKPVFADIDNSTGNIDPQEIPKRVTHKTKAVISVSWGGNPPDLENLVTQCQRYGLKLIQDNAQALGAFYYTLPVTQYGDFNCFSFQAIKPLTTGDGGLLVCKYYEDYKQAKKLRWFGIDREEDLPDMTGERVYNLSRVGYKYHMTDLAAALGLGNLVDINSRTERRNDIANYYDQKFSLSCYSIIRMPGSSDWLYTVLVDRRDDFIYMMTEKNIPVSVVHVGIDRNDVFGGKWNLPNQRYWDEHHICLPIHPSLTDEDVEKVVQAVRGGW